ncbi:MAG: F0F1 ATP synthase subunit delta [Candidatus Moranbacteria bacterium]|jgi:F-type H+-transporting ATPase subunit delta|nr:F0F1 ATP synthase subunit delta [Candidatus Moranbacteria bacterium]
MKITAKQYAQILNSMTAGKSQQEVCIAVEKFAKVLKKNNQQKLEKSIERKFGEIYNKENGIVEAVIVSAEKLTGNLVDKIADFIKKKYSAKEVILEDKIDKKIKGGFILRVEDEILDASISGRLAKLKKELILK